MGKYSYNEKFLAEWLEQEKKKGKDGCSQKDVAAVLGTNNDGVIRWSKGDFPKDAKGHKDKTKPRKVTAMSGDNIATFCNHFGCDIGDFFLYDGEPTKVVTKKSKKGKTDTDETENLREQLKISQEMNELKGKLLKAYETIGELRDKLERKSDTSSDHAAFAGEKTLAT